jgi:hypothetical protein
MLQQINVVKQPRIGWGGWAILLPYLYSIKLAKQHAAGLRRHLRTEAWDNLTKKAYDNSLHQDLTGIPAAFGQYLFSSDAMLSHPLLIHFIRPAVRMALAAGHKISGIPIIMNPSLRFGGQTIPLKPDLKVAEIPLGLIFLFRELGRGILNLHNAIYYKEPDNIRVFAQACSDLSILIYKPATLAFSLGNVYLPAHHLDINSMHRK